jgi:hypothetical protein
VTPSGIRITGSGAEAVVQRLAAPAPLAPGRAEDALFGASFVIRTAGRSGARTLECVLEVLDSAVVTRFSGGQRLTRSEPFVVAPTRFGGLGWDTLGEADAWVGELRWRRPHPVIAGAPITTEMLLTEQPGQLRLHVRVTADEGTSTIRGNVGAGQARPEVLTELRRAVRLTSAGWDGTPLSLGEADIDGFVRDVLLGDDRTEPAAVLTPLEDGTFVVPPAELADALLGLARLYVIPVHADTFRLSDVLGDRRLSAYWGALRIYMPRFSCADRPTDHPLLVADQLQDPVMRADALGRLGRQAGQALVLPPTIAERRATLAAAVAAARVPETASASPVPSPAAGTDTRPATTAEPAVPAEALGTAAGAAPRPAADRELAAPSPAPAVLAPAVLTALGEILAAVRQLDQHTLAVQDELGRLRTGLTVRAANTAALERRIARFEGRMETLIASALARLGGDVGSSADAAAGASLGEAPQADEDRLTLVDILRHATAAHSETLLILESAEGSAAESPYEDLDRVSAVLDAMADVARRRADGVLGMTLRDAFRDLGVDYRGGIAESTSAQHRQQYLFAGPRGVTYDCVEHLALGDSYDPRYCLRIYFTSRAPAETRFVIGHVGRHFDVKTTT